MMSLGFRFVAGYRTQMSESVARQLPFHRTTRSLDLICRLIVVVCFLAGVEKAHAGGGGENMLLVVNPNDPASLQIANAYAALRDIPANNLLYIARRRITTTMANRYRRPRSATTI